MKPGFASTIASEIRLAGAVPLMESVIALALAYAARLSDYPTVNNSPTTYWLTNYAGVVSGIVSEINEEQFMQVELLMALVKDAYVARCNNAYRPELHSGLETITAGWDANTWKAYSEIHCIFATEFGTASGA